MTRQLDATQFLADVVNHKITIKLDTKPYRHLIFQKPQNSNMWFDLITWPGYLTICGDMGTWTFARVPDMFTFFRSENLRINKDYWAEKLHHGVHGGRDGAKVFDEDLFRKRLVDQLTEHYGLEGDQLRDVSDALRNEVLLQDGKYDLLIAARDFKHGNFRFDTCELPDGKEYAYHFVWCLYAIVWGIQQYDSAKAVANTEACA